MKKKADANIFMMIVRFIFVGIILLTVFMFIRISISHSFDTQETEANIISARLFYQPDCFIYQDPDTNRFYPNIIDLNQFTDDRINSCYSMRNDSGYYAFRAMLFDASNNQIKNITFNSVKFNLYENLYSSTSGKVIDRFIKEIYVQYKESGNIKQGKIVIELYIPKK